MAQQVRNLEAKSCNFMCLPLLSPSLRLSSITSPVHHWISTCGARTRYILVEGTPKCSKSTSTPPDSSLDTLNDFLFVKCLSIEFFGWLCQNLFLTNVFARCERPRRSLFRAAICYCFSSFSESVRAPNFIGLFVFFYQVNELQELLKTERQTSHSLRVRCAKLERQFKELERKFCDRSQDVPKENDAQSSSLQVRKVALFNTIFATFDWQKTCDMNEVSGLPTSEPSKVNITLCHKDSETGIWASANIEISFFSRPLIADQPNWPRKYQNGLFAHTTASFELLLEDTEFSEQTEKITRQANFFDYHES